MASRQPKVTPAINERVGSRGRTRVEPNRWGSVPERLAYLFATVHPTGRRKPYSAAEVAEGIQADGTQISEVYLHKILSGERTDPAARFLKGIARFFGVSLAYFYADAADGELDQRQLSDLAMLHDPVVRKLLYRATQLSPSARAAVLDIATTVLRAEGKIVEDDEAPRSDHAGGEAEIKPQLAGQAAAGA